jgi:hypothetical protein
MGGDGAIVKVHGYVGLAEVIGADGRAPDGRLARAAHEAIELAARAARSRCVDADGDRYLDLTHPGADASRGVRAIGEHLSALGYTVRVVETVVCAACGGGPLAEDCGECGGRGYTPGSFLRCH